MLTNRSGIYRDLKIQQPTFLFISDLRGRIILISTYRDDPDVVADLFISYTGGRTAWSSEISVNGKIFKARFWYDGFKNAREDAAEVAVKSIQAR
jgi:hypothetical protein